MTTTSAAAAVCCWEASKAKGLLFALLLVTAPAGVAAPAAAQSPAPPGAAGCSGCHSRAGAEAAAMQPLAGRPAEEIVAAMQAFRTGQRSATVMDRIAKGFSDEETRAIAAWVGAQQ